jgi:hypothetical protein
MRLLLWIRLSVYVAWPLLRALLCIRLSPLPDCIDTRHISGMCSALHPSICTICC